MQSQNDLFNENITINNQPFTIIVNLLKKRVFFDNIHIEEPYVDCFKCVLKNKDDNYSLIGFFNMSVIISETANVNFSHETINALRTEIFNNSIYLKYLLFGIRKCVKELSKYTDEPRKRIDRCYTLDLGKDPTGRLSKVLTIKANDDIDQRTGTNFDKINQNIYLIIESLHKHFKTFSNYSVYLSSDYSWSETHKSLEYLKREKIINRSAGPIGFKPEMRDNAKKILGLEQNIILNCLFKDIKIPYENIIFIIMHFTKEKFEWLGNEDNPNSLRQFIANKAKAKCVTVADDKRGYDILDKIYSHLIACKFAIADIASLNPNVLYELGMANSLGKNVILICSKDELAKINPKVKKDDLFGKFLKSVFDLNHRTIIEYETDEQLRNELETSIEQTLKTL